MSHRWSAAAALGSMLLLVGCSGGDGEDPAPGGDPGGTPPPSASAPVYTPFEKIPGDELLHTGIGEPLGIRVKAVDAMWTPELAGESAAAGRHFLAAYFAATGELADRAVKNARLTDLTLRITPASGTCAKGPRLQEGEIDCVTESYPRSQLAEVADGEWRNFSWTSMRVMGSTIQRGETKIGVVGFSLPDTVDPTALELCAPTKEHPVDTTAFPCVPVKAPDNSRS